MSVIFGGCSIPNLILYNKTESYKYSLTARQKQILKQEGLPLDYEELDDTQKGAIECIDDIFKYLDKTYPKEKYGKSQRKSMLLKKKMTGIMMRKSRFRL